MLVVFATPALRTRFLAYGARANVPTATKEKEDGSQDARRNRNILSAMLDTAKTLQVPHSWFASFYAVSVTCSLFWAAELLFRGSAFRSISRFVSLQQSAMTPEQVKVAWALMFAQGCRRLYECITLARPSRSQMWCGHWVLGILFYIGTSVAIWVEGVCKSKPRVCRRGVHAHILLQLV